MSRSFKRKKPLYEIDCYAIWQYVWKRAINLCFCKMFLIPSLRISLDLPNWYFLFFPSQYPLRWILDFPMNLCCIFCKEFHSNAPPIFWKGQSKSYMMIRILELWRMDYFQILLPWRYPWFTTRFCWAITFWFHLTFLDHCYINTKF